VCNNSSTRAAITPCTRNGSSQFEVRWEAGIVSLLMELLIVPCVRCTTTPNTMHGPRMAHASAPHTAKPKVAALSMASVYVIEDACQVDYDFIMVQASSV
jgi:hypothetical protein